MCNVCNVYVLQPYLPLTPNNSQVFPARTFATIDVPVREAINQGIDEEMEADDRVYCIGEEVSGRVTKVGQL